MSEFYVYTITSMDSGDKKSRIAELRAEASARADDTLSSMKLTAKSLAVLGS